MAINQERLQTKLGAIQAKDLDAILAQQVYLPFLGSDYTRNQLENWLNKCSDFLIEAQTVTEQFLENKKNLIYNSLSASDKLIADKILAGEPYELSASNADNYDKLRLLALYKFITEA